MKTLIACGLMKPDLERLIEESHIEYNVIWMEAGLHNTPEKLRNELQSIIDSTIGSEEIVITYGLCGNALIGLKATTAPIRYLRTDDCISAIMCENPKLLDLRRCSMFTNKSWLSSPIAEDNQIKRAIDKYGENADWIIDELYKNYTNTVYMQTETEIEKEYLERAEQMAKMTKTELVFEPANYNAYNSLLTGKEYPIVNILEKGCELGLNDFYNFQK